jgi:peptide/nickel transport system ATP-binding protein
VSTASSIPTEPTELRSDTPPRLAVYDLEIGLGQDGPQILSEISLTVQAGHVLGLVGESGSGKTTLALALSGYARRGLAFRRGEVRLDGQNLLALSPNKLRTLRGAAVAYVPQDPAAALNPALTIGSQVREALTVHRAVTGDVDKRVAEVLHEVRLDPTRDMLRRYPHQLSGGQQQRVVLAMAFACRPSLIVLDEPTTGLDVSTQRHVLETVQSLCRSYQVAGVYVSHDLAVVSQIVTDVAVLYAGHLVELGPLSDIFRQPLHPYTQGLLAAVPSLERPDEARGIPGQLPRPGTRDIGCRFAPRCPYALPICLEQVPRLLADDNRLIRCHRASERLQKPPIDADRQNRRRNRAPAERPVLNIESLSASYRKTDVLFDIDLSLERESCLAVVGESGSGKTTLARCIVGMHRSWTGAISYEGTSLPRSAAERPRSVLREVQYIFQNPYTALNPRKTIGQILGQPLDHFSNTSRAEQGERIQQALDDVALDNSFLSRHPAELSGGERQRVAIARALIVEPKLLVCDEVTSALDVSVQAVIVELLRKLQQERHLTMIFITHNVALVRSVAQTAAVLHGGRLVEHGSVDQVLAHPNARYTAGLLRDVPDIAWRTSATA